MDHWKQISREILIEIYTFSFPNKRLKISYGKWRPFCLDINVIVVKETGPPGAKVATNKNQHVSYILVFMNCITTKVFHLYTHQLHQYLDTMDCGYQVIQNGKEMIAHKSDLEVTTGSTYPILSFARSLEKWPR